MGQFVYLTRETDRLAVKRIGSGGALLPVKAGEFFPTGRRPVSVAVDSTGQFVYVVNGGDNTVSATALVLAGRSPPSQGRLSRRGVSPGLLRLPRKWLSGAVCYTRLRIWWSNP